MSHRPTVLIAILSLNLVAEIDLPLVAQTERKTPPWHFPCSASGGPPLRPAGRQDGDQHLDDLEIFEWWIGDLGKPASAWVCPSAPARIPEQPLPGTGQL
jgi:hypothetical protein